MEDKISDGKSRFEASKSEGWFIFARSQYGRLLLEVLPVPNNDEVHSYH